MAVIIRSMLVVVLGTLGLLPGAEPVPAEAQPIVIRDDAGGFLYGYVNRAVRWRNAGQRVEIAGTCMSACTIYLMSPHTCVRPGAVLKFHAVALAHTPDRASQLGNRYIMQFYPRAVRSWIASKGGLRSVDRYLTLKGTALSKIVPPCGT